MTTWMLFYHSPSCRSILRYWVDIVHEPRLDVHLEMRYSSERSKVSFLTWQEILLSIEGTMCPEGEGTRPPRCFTHYETSVNATVHEWDGIADPETHGFSRDWSWESDTLLLQHYGSGARHSNLVLGRRSSQSDVCETVYDSKFRTTQNLCTRLFGWRFPIPSKHDEEVSKYGN